MATKYFSEEKVFLAELARRAKARIDNFSSDEEYGAFLANIISQTDEERYKNEGYSCCDNLIIVEIMEHMMDTWFAIHDDDASDISHLANFAVEGDFDGNRGLLEHTASALLYITVAAEMLANEQDPDNLLREISGYVKDARQKDDFNKWRYDLLYATSRKAVRDGHNLFDTEAILHNLGDSYASFEERLTGKSKAALIEALLAPEGLYF